MDFVIRQQGVYLWKLIKMTLLLIEYWIYYLLYTCTMLGVVQLMSTIECILYAFCMNDTRVRCVREV